MGENIHLIQTVPKEENVVLLGTNRNFQIKTTDEKPLVKDIKTSTEDYHQHRNYLQESDLRWSSHAITSGDKESSKTKVEVLSLPSSTSTPSSSEVSQQLLVNLEDPRSIPEAD